LYRTKVEKGSERLEDARVEKGGPPCLTNDKRYCPRLRVLARNGPATDHHHLQIKVRCTSEL
jgi:hypothetical protein